MQALLCCSESFFSLRGIQTACREAGTQQRTARLRLHFIPQVESDACAPSLCAHAQRRCTGSRHRTRRSCSGGCRQRWGWRRSTRCAHPQHIPALRLTPKYIVVGARAWTASAGPYVEQGPRTYTVQCANGAGACAQPTCARVPCPARSQARRHCAPCLVCLLCGPEGRDGRPAAYTFLDAAICRRLATPCLAAGSLGGPARRTDYHADPRQGSPDGCATKLGDSPPGLQGLPGLAEAARASCPCCRTLQGSCCWGITIPQQQSLTGLCLPPLLPLRSAARQGGAARRQRARHATLHAPHRAAAGNRPAGGEGCAAAR